MPASTVDQTDTSVNAVLDHLQERAAELFGSEKLLALRHRSVLTRPHSQLHWVEAVFPDGTRSLVIKIPRQEPLNRPERADKARRRLEKEFQTVRDLAEQIADKPGLGVTQALAFFPNIPALVMAEVQGSNTRDLIISKGQWFPKTSAAQELDRACFAAGAWLKTFQSLTAKPRQRLDLDQMIDYVDLRLRRLAEFGPLGLDQLRRQNVLALFDRLRNELSDVEWTVSGVHGDFCPSNVLWSGKSVTVVDFSTFQTGSVYYDLTRFYHQLGLFLNKFSFRANTIAHLRRAFLQGYDELPAPTKPLFRLFMVQHTVCHWLGRLKRTPGSIREQLYNRWVCHHHRHELDRLLTTEPPHAS